MIEAHNNTTNDLDHAGLQAVFFHKYPDADRDIYASVFKDLEAEVDPNLAELMLKQMRDRKTAMKLSEEAFKFSSGNGTAEAIAEAYGKFATASGNEGPEYNFVSDDLEQLLADTVQRHGLRWRLNFLNSSLGSLRQGDFGFIFARPETGKTTFLASEISEMLKGLPEDAGPILWFNNEEQGSKVMIRLYQAYFGVNLEQLLANPKRYRDEFNRQVRGRFKLVDDANINKSLVERLLKQHRPSLVIFDQITKIKGFAADREDLKLGAICVWARELAKQYAPIIGVFQAGGSAEGQKWLTMDHVANVTTAAQAEADWILGIGTVHSEGTQYIRYLNISKNKLSGDSDTLAHLRHGRSEVLIEPQIARYRDIQRSYG